MLESGYIKVYRSLLFWEWYDDANTLRVFLHLLLTANHEEQSWKGIKVQRGQRVSSFSKIGQELGLSEKEVRTAVRHLIKTGEVAHNANSKYGVFTVNNYDRFQMRAPSGEPEREPKWHPEGGQPEGHSGTRRATKEEGKEKKKKEKEPPISPLDPFDAYAGSNGELLKSLRDFEQMRARIKAPLTERAKQLVVTQLEKFSDGIRDKERYQRECLERSILNSWKGLFPLKDFEDSPEKPPNPEDNRDHPVKIDLDHFDIWELVP